MKIHIVFKTHFDIGFTDLAEEIIKKYSSQMIGDVIKTCEDTRHLGAEKRYVWTMPSWPLKESISLGNAIPADDEKAVALTKEGQITWHVLPFTTHTEFCGLEEFIRGFLVSGTLSHTFGKWPLSAKMTDVPGHTWILPSLLAKAGVKFLHLGCNPGCKAPDVPRIFWWEGPDGGRVLTFYNKGGYGTDFFPPEDWEYPVWLALMQTGDNAGPQESEVIYKILEKIKVVLPEAEVAVGTLDDFYRDFVNCNLDIPVIKQDLADTWIHGVGTYPAEVSILRRSRRVLAEAEKLVSYSLMWGRVPPGEAEEAIREIYFAYEQGLLFGEHTWGLDVKTAMGGFRHYSRAEFEKNRAHSIYRRMEASWEEQRRRARTVKQISERLADLYGKCVASSVSHENGDIVVMNTTGQRRDAWIYIDRLKDGMSNAFIDTRDGTVFPLHAFDGRYHAFIKGLPAFGAVALKQQEGVLANASEYCHAFQDATLKGIENKKYRICVDCIRGEIISLMDKTTGKEWVAQGKEHGFGRYRYDIYGIDDMTEFIRNYSYRFYDWLVNDLGRILYPHVPHATYYPECVSVDCTCEDSGAILTIKKVNSNIQSWEYGDADEVITRIYLPAFDDVIKIRFELKGKHETSMIEAGHFVFPIKLSNPRYRINKLGSVVDPAVDIAGNANHAVYCLENWLDVNDGASGICFVSQDAPLFSIGREGMYKFQREYAEREPTIYFNAFNNVWGTNFPQWMGGDFAYEFSIFTHTGDWQEGDVARKVSDIVNPPLVWCAENSSNAVHQNAGLFEFDGGVEVIALKTAHFDKDSFILRVREMNGNQGAVIFKPHPMIKAVETCDLQERPITHLEPDCEGHFVLKTRPFEIHSLILRV